MSASFDSFQVLYSDGAPTSFIRLGQLLIDESEATPLDMLKICTDDSPLTYTSLSDGISASILAANNTWTGTNTFTAQVTMTSAINLLLENTGPQIRWTETDAATDEQDWIMLATDGEFQLRAYPDNFAAGFNIAFTITRTGEVLDAFILQEDDYELRFGAGGDDLAIYHNGTTNFIDANNGSLYITASGGQRFGILASPATVRLAGAAAGDAVRYSIYTDQTLVTERGYWGYPSTTSDLMVMRNTAGSEIDFRVSDNVGYLNVNTAGVRIEEIEEVAANVLRSGTYVPTPVNTTNVAASTGQQCNYMRVGDMCHVAFRVTIDPTAAAAVTVLGIPLPIASNLTAINDVVGAGVDNIVPAAGESQVYTVAADTANNRAILRSESIAGAGNRTVMGTFLYRIL